MSCHLLELPAARVVLPHARATGGSRCPATCSSYRRFALSCHLLELPAARVVLPLARATGGSRCPVTYSSYRRLALSCHLLELPAARVVLLLARATRGSRRLSIFMHFVHPGLRPSDLPFVLSSLRRFLFYLVRCIVQIIPPLAQPARRLIPPSAYPSVGSSLLHLVPTEAQSSFRLYSIPT